MKDNVKKRIVPIIVFTLILIAFYWVFFVPSKNDELYNNEICDTKRMQISGIISGHGGHGIYQWIQVDNLSKSVTISVEKIKFTKGFTEDYVDYQVGDSIIKESNSKELIIKRDTCIAVYILDCDD